MLNKQIIHQKKELEKIKNFWEKQPLYFDEVENVGTKEYFEKIKKIFIDDLFAGNVDKRILPKKINQIKILDLGSGPGLYTRLFYENGCKDLYSADLTITANNLVKDMCKIYDFKNIKIFNENAENLSFERVKCEPFTCLIVISSLVISVIVPIFVSGDKFNVIITFGYRLFASNETICSWNPCCGSPT
jgi:SAM-dependent methyltransferase